MLRWQQSIAGGFTERRKQARQVVRFVVGIQSACARQRPDPRAMQVFGLEAKPCFRAVERRAICADADECHAARSVAKKLSLQNFRALHIFFGCQFRRGIGGAGNQIGDAVTEGEQFMFFVRSEQAVCKSGFVQRGPEPVARPRKVMSHRRCVKSGIDSAEKHVQPSGNDIGQRFAESGQQFFFGWFTVGHGVVIRQSVKQGFRAVVPAGKASVQAPSARTVVRLAAVRGLLECRATFAGNRDSRFQSHVEQ